jgi:hypothetical protein
MKIFLKIEKVPSAVACACNHSYLGDRGKRPAWARSSKPCLKEQVGWVVHTFNLSYMEGELEGSGSRFEPV